MSLRFRAEQSYHGLDPAVLKSGMQKYLRRGERDKGLWCLVEMDLFQLAREHLSEIAERDGATESACRTRATSLRTNMVNRLVVMMSEEVNVHGWWLPAQLWPLYQRWSKLRDRVESRRALVEMYLSLLASPKCRLVSDYRTIFNLPPYYLPEAQHDTLVKLHQAFLREHDAELFRLNYEQKKLSSMSAAQLSARSLELARAESDEALLFCGRLFDKPDFSSAANGMFVELAKMVPNDGVIDALASFYKAMNHREKPIYLYHALMLACFRSRIDWSKKSQPASMNDADVEALYQRHIQGGALALDEYVHDRHTGVRSADSRSVFALEGAKVENEDRRFMQERYRALYVGFKEAIDTYEVTGKLPAPSGAKA